VVDAIKTYAGEVKSGAFPTEKESFVKQPAVEEPERASSEVA